MGTPDGADMHALNGNTHRGRGATPPKRNRISRDSSTKKVQDHLRGCVFPFGEEEYYFITPFTDEGLELARCNAHKAAKTGQVTRYNQHKYKNVCLNPSKPCDTKKYTQGQLLCAERYMYLILNCKEQASAEYGYRFVCLWCRAHLTPNRCELYGGEDDYINWLENHPDHQPLFQPLETCWIPSKKVGFFARSRVGKGGIRQHPYLRFSVCSAYMEAHVFSKRIFNDYNTQPGNFGCSHLCHNPRCVRPGHIFVEPILENIARRSCSKRVYGLEENKIMDFCKCNPSCISVGVVHSLEDIR